MKFNHGFKESLVTQEFPRHWVDRAIPYGQLKKCLKKVTRELRDIGLDPETLRSLLDPGVDAPLAVQYRLRASEESSLVRPQLTVNVYLRDGQVVDACLTPATRLFFEKIAIDLPADGRGPLPHESRDPQAEVNDGCQPDYETIEVPLVFDAEFFDILQSDVSNLDALHAEEGERMRLEICELGKEVGRVAKPSRLSRTDQVRWRHIFELYLDAQVFFATQEQDHGSRNSQTALQQLRWFQGEVDKRCLAKGFRLRDSHTTYNRFLQLNLGLLKNLQFQELNKMAVSKILKKFDKRTSLGVSKAFTVVVHSDRLLTGNIAKDVCAQMSQELVAVVPQLNDYLCPICFAVAYLPVRLDCRHVFCIRCIIKIQRRKETNCPLCRADVVMKTSVDNLDYKLAKYMKQHFANEVREKARANDMERGIEDYGPNYKPQECSLM